MVSWSAAWLNMVLKKITKQIVNSVFIRNKDKASFEQSSRMRQGTNIDMRFIIAPTSIWLHYISQTGSSKAPILQRSHGTST